MACFLYILASKCIDKRTDCKEIEKHYGWCTSKRAEMEAICPATCNFCSRLKEIVQPVPTNLPKTTTGNNIFENFPIILSLEESAKIILSFIFQQ